MGVLVVIEVASSRLLELASIVLVDLKIGGSLAVGRIHGVVTVGSPAIVVVGISPFGVRGGVCAEGERHDGCQK